MFEDTLLNIYKDEFLYIHNLFQQTTEAIAYTYVNIYT